MKTLVTFGGAPPIIVAVGRGAVEAALLGGVGYLVTFLQGVDFKDYVQFAPLVFAFLRQSEGVIDEIIDPTQNRTTIPAGTLAKYLQGLGGVSGSIVAFFRGSLEVGALAALGFGLESLETVDWGDHVVLAPIFVWALRSLEGLADRFIDPSKNRL